MHLRIHLGLLFLIPQAEDFVCDGIVVLFVICFLDELLLQFLEAFVDAFRGEGAGVYDSLCHVLLHLLNEGIAVFAKPVDGFQRNFLEEFLIYRPVCAVFFSGGRFEPTDAAPDDGLLATVVPVDASVELTTLSAADDLGEAIVAGEAALLTRLRSMNVPAADQLRLHLHEDFLRNNRFVVILDIVLRDDTGVLDALLGQEVRRVGLLKQGVAHVFFIPQDLVDRAVVPFRSSRSGEDTVLFETFRYSFHAVAFEVLAVNALDDLGLLWINDEVPVLVLRVAEEMVVVDLDLSLLVAVLESELYVLRKGLGFLLGEACHDRDQHLALGMASSSTLSPGTITVRSVFFPSRRRRKRSRMER